MSTSELPASGTVATAARDELITGEAVALDLRPADFILRAAGALIDWLSYVVVFLGVMFVLSMPIISDNLDEAMLQAVTIGALVLCLVAIPTTVETLTKGRSLGKLAVGARIVRDDGGAIGLRHAFIRSLTAVLEIFMTGGGLAIIVSILNPRAKRIGDMIAGTYSQYERVAKYSPPTFDVPVQLADWAKTADVAPLPPLLARRVSQFLQQAHGHTAASRQRLATELAAEARPYVSPIPDGDPELFLAAITAVRRDREYRALRGGQQRLEKLAPVLSGMPHQFPDR